MAKVFKILKVLAETDEDLEEILTNLDKTVVQVDSTMPHNRRNREFKIIYEE